MSPLFDNAFIFSDTPKYRIARHLIFWFVYWLYFGLLHAANSFGAKEIMYFQNLPYTLTESILMIIPQVAITYPLLYLIFPYFFLKKKYISGVVLTIALWFVAACLSLYMAINVNQQVLAYLMPVRFLRIPQRPPNVTFFMSLLVVMKGGVLGASVAFWIKLMKYWYIKEQHNLQLQKENTAAQLQLLTAQVHPHFLFNTLNNIFSQTQTESPKGSSMIMSLSDMLRYILYEGRKPLVPLRQEIAMIREYIQLEKIRYGNKLDVHVLVPDKLDDIMIAPLLLLPFIENCFKHGASHMLSDPWINLTIEMNDCSLIMKLMNGKANSEGVLPEKSGIGIQNVKQRLELLYKGKYELQVRAEEEVFVVDLKVELVKIPKPYLCLTEI